MTDRDRAYRAVLEDCLAVKEGEQVLILTDPKRRPIAGAW